MENQNKSAADESKPQQKTTFSGNLGYILAVAGSAVGLGNIWRFPYLAAKYGGGIFLLVYLILMLTFGYALIVSETALGRMTGKSPDIRRLDQRGHSDIDPALLQRYRRVGGQICL